MYSAIPGLSILPLLPLLLLPPTAVATAAPYTSNCCSLRSSFDPTEGNTVRAYDMNIPGWGNSDAANPKCGEGLVAALLDKCGVDKVYNSWGCYGSEGAPHDTAFTFQMKGATLEVDACIAEAWKAAGGPGKMSCSTSSTCLPPQCNGDCDVQNEGYWGRNIGG